LEEDVAPKGLALLDHVHVSKAPDPARPGKFTIGPSTKLVAADLNPQFYDSAGVLKLDSSPTGLQTCFDAMMKSAFGGFLSRAGHTSPHPDDVAHVAVVDLTGAKRSAPEFAHGARRWICTARACPRSLPCMRRSSSAPTCANLINRKSPADGKQLEAAAIAEWKCEGLQDGSARPGLALRHPQVDASVGSRFHPGRAGHFRQHLPQLPGGDPDRKGQHALHRVGCLAVGPVPSDEDGLWLRASYCDKGTWASPVKSPWVHNVTALSAATYFTLLAQGPAGGHGVLHGHQERPAGGCVTRLFPTLPVVASKCGWYNGWIHDCAWIQDGSVRYVMAVLSHQTKPAHEALYTQLCAQIDTLVRLNNQTPKASCP